MKNIIQQPDIFGKEVTIYLNTPGEELKLGVIETIQGDYRAIRERDRAIMVTRDRNKALDFITTHKLVNKITQINLF